jgi:hypothetical protein
VGIFFPCFSRLSETHHFRGADYPPKCLVNVANWAATGGIRLILTPQLRQASKLGRFVQRIPCRYPVFVAVRVLLRGFPLRFEIR